MNNLPRVPRPGDLGRAIATRLVAKMEAHAALTEDGLLASLAELAGGAKKVTRVKRGGQVVEEIEVEEPGTRLAAVDKALQLRAAYPAKQLDVSGTLRVESLHELALRLEGLPDDKLAEIIEAEALALPPGDSA